MGLAAPAAFGFSWVCLRLEMSSGTSSCGGCSCHEILKIAKKCNVPYNCCCRCPLV